VPYARSEIGALYTHSLFGAALIAALAYRIGVMFWKTRTTSDILASLSFSRCINDLGAHHTDMPWQPGNTGNLPLLGFGLWDFEYAIFCA
jgi:hypothetical protein